MTMVSDSLPHCNKIGIFTAFLLVRLITSALTTVFVILTIFYSHKGSDNKVSDQIKETPVTNILKESSHSPWWQEFRLPTKTQRRIWKFKSEANWKNLSNFCECWILLRSNYDHLVCINIVIREGQRPFRPYFGY